MVAKTTISLDEFLKLPDFEEDGTHYELDEGKLITLSPSGGRQAKRIDKIVRCNHAERVYLHTGFPVVTKDLFL
jgi:Putative restriction endonuclease